MITAFRAAEFIRRMPSRFRFHSMRNVAIETKACAQALRQGDTAMALARPLQPRLTRGTHLVRLAAASLALVALGGCEQNTYAPPPPPKSAPYPMANCARLPAVAASAKPSVLTAAQTSIRTGADATR